MLKKYADSLGVDDAAFCKYLADWGDIIRRTFYDGGVDEVISTRRLVHIIRAYSILLTSLRLLRSASTVSMMRPRSFHGSL